MVIPESILDHWSRRRITQTAVRAHEYLRGQLRAPESAVSGIHFEDYLQGSYANFTDIPNDRDVDIVIQLNQTFHYSVSGLPEPSASLCRSSISPAVFDPDKFRPMIIDRLVEVFGQSQVKPGSKAIRVQRDPGERLDADVLVCQQYRRYGWFNGDPEEGYTEGMYFQHQQTSEEIINYPRQHLANGEAKNLATNGGFKAAVRIYKSARNFLVDTHMIEDTNAPSYFLQGLLYNVPDDQFSQNSSLNFLSPLVWLNDNMSTFHTFVCQNGLQWLFGDTTMQWNQNEALEIIQRLTSLSVNWSKP